MKAVVVTPDQRLALSDAPAPALRPGEVRIRVHASGVNRADTLQRRGHYPPPPGESELPGLEVAGEVIERAPDAKRFTIGARVMALLAGGGYAEEACAPETQCLPIPDGMTFEDAAIPKSFSPLTSTFSRSAGRARAAALIHAGASGVGTAGIQLLVLAGAQVWVTVGSREKAERCRALGAEAIDYKTERWPARLPNEGMDVILDPVGASYFPDNVRALAMDGRLVNIGLMGGVKAEIDLRELLNRRARVIASTLRGLPRERKAAVVENFRAQFYDALTAGKIRPIVDRVFPAAEAMAAHERMEANANFGKIILAWRD